MYATLALLALVGCAAASPALLLTHAYDDGQWHPEFDGSISARLAYDDGSWKPDTDGSIFGRGDLTWFNRRKRDVSAVAPLPLDEPVTAYAKNAHLIQQQTEGTRNILGGGIPLDLPADTPEVAAGKQAHAIAHENQKLATASPYAHYAVAAAPLATPFAARYVAPAYSHAIATPYSIGYPYHPYSYAGLRAFY